MQTLAELIQRIAPPDPVHVQHRTIVARARELDRQGKRSRGDWWVLLHSASSQRVLLIHRRRIAATQLELKIDAPLGEVLCARLDVRSTRSVGELFETTAEFLAAALPENG